MAARTWDPDGNRAERLFLELLRPGVPRGCDGATADELRETSALAFRHGMFLLVDRRIREYRGSATAGRAAGEYEKTARTLRRRHVAYALQYESAETSVLALLDAAGIPSVILKGSGLSRDLYGDPHYRTSADIDLLVRPEDVPAAEHALGAAGYRRDNNRPLSFWMRRLHHAVYQQPGSRVPVEIHWHFSIPGFFNLDPAAIWDGVARDGLRGRLRPDMSLTMLLMHHHLHGCADLRTLVDLIWAGERYRQEQDALRLAEHFKSAGLLVVAGIARLQAEKLWGPQIWCLGRNASPHALRASLLAKAAGLALRPDRRQRPSDRFLHALVHRLGLDSPRRVIGAVTKSILPSAADMHAFSGDRRSALAGYLYYYRWRLGGEGAGSREPRGLRQ